MKILFLTTDLSYPPNDGRMLRTYNVLSGLARRHSVSLACFDQRHGPDPQARRREAESHLRTLCASVEVFDIPSRRTRVATALTAGMSLFGRQPFSSRSYWVPAALRYLLSLTAVDGFDVVHIENTLLGDHVPRGGRAARVLVHHNVESDLFFQRAASEPNPARRAFMRLEASKMRAFERRMGPRFGAHIVCSSEDADRLKAIMGEASLCVVPNGVDLDYFSPRPNPRNGLLGVVHVGGLNWPPNLQGASWFVNEVWPAVRRALPNATLTLVGRSGEAPRTGWHGRDGITCLGEVEDVRPYFAEASVSIVPLHVGGGTRLKILNAWAMGTPVVSTTKGCEGLPARHGETILIGDTAGAFADSVVRLLREPALRDAMRSSARRLVEADYGWKSIVERTESAYRVAAGVRGG
jgi:glycosyltransferase involved in cell wall biosynthesis